MLKSILCGLGGACAATLVVTTTAFAGSGVGGTFNLGVSNTVSAVSILTGTSSGAMLEVRNAATGANAVSVLGRVTSPGSGSSSAGVRGNNAGKGADRFGVLGNADGGTGVYGLGGIYGVLGLTATPGGTAVFGRHSSTAGTAPGVEGDSASTDVHAVGVRGVSTGAGIGTGVWGISPHRIGVRGVGGENGVYGVSGEPTFFGNGDFAFLESGVWGDSKSGMGVAGESTDDIAVYGSSQNNTGVFGFGLTGIEGGSTIGLAGYFNGDVEVKGDLDVTGTVTKGGGAFRIDDPLDPAHKFLQHSFVESPDMMNVYNGNVVTNGKGFATVRLPAYFQALNRDFRYQLTIVGTRGWNARVVDEISHGRFIIQTDQPKVEVSWQVTGIRHDRYANAHRIRVEVPKAQALEKLRRARSGGHALP
jgi:hypothetical protein